MQNSRLEPIWQIVEIVQMWAELCHENKIKLPADELPGDNNAIPIHSGVGKQNIMVVPFNNLQRTLHMARFWYNGLRRYGEDPMMRFQRIDNDEDELVDLMNKVLDEKGRTMLAILGALLARSGNPEDVSESTSQPQ